jgi:NAD(P)H-dependent FMN reductase
MSAGRFLVVCGSRKPAPGTDRPSAARELLRVVVAGMAEAGAEAEWLDVRELDLPFFDGRDRHEYGSLGLDRLGAAVAAAEVIVLSVPAYWAGPAGVVKNMLDVLGGAAYDQPPGTATPLNGKTVALLVVGADDESAAVARSQVQATLASMGAWTAPRAAVVANPRKIRSMDAVMNQLKAFGRYAAGLRPAAVEAPA